MSEATGNQLDALAVLVSQFHDETWLCSPHEKARWLLDHGVRVAAGAGDPPEALNEAALDAAERAYWDDDGVSRHNMAAAIRAYLVTSGDRPPAPSEAARRAAWDEISMMANSGNSPVGGVFADAWIDTVLRAAYAVDCGAVRPTPRAAPDEEP